ncbi:MAG TPA: tetratricopeptide repeat protein [Thermoanaerobaculia bacterium]|nr:tetratricopeptide repeat protein [Thermoanaerobaculia bacterium]
MLRSCASALVIALFFAGCSTYQAFDSVGHLRSQYGQNVGAETAAKLVVPFELDDEMIAALPKNRAPTELRRLNQVMEVVFERLDLRYEQAPTRTAIETFRAHRGNCLSFVNLFVALSRANNLNPFYVEVTDYQKWSHQAGMVVSQGHIVAGMYLDGELKTYDFLPYRPKAYRKFQPIDDLQAAAHFYNNLGAEALLGGDPARARELIEVAAHIQPTFVKAINNLGVVLARAGDVAGAQDAYRRALAVEPDNAIVMTNMARLLQQQGKSDEAQTMLAQVEASNISNPYFFVYQGDLALARGDQQKALDYMVKALRLDAESSDVHVGLVKVYLALGDTEKAKHHLGRALALDATNTDALRYAALIGR